jgi:copper resistance protein B
MTRRFEFFSRHGGLLAVALFAIAPRAGHAQAHDHAAAPPAGAYAAPALTPADREAAFPDLGEMDMGAMMVEDPFNKAVLFDRLETQDGDLASWDFEGWVGRNAGRLWLRGAGERASGTTQRAELQLLYGRPITRWWDVVAGVREDFQPGPSRSWAAFGVQGLAPYRFELEATAFVGEGGRSAARLEAHYELLITNRWILQPLVDLDWYGQSDPGRGVGAGLASAETGLRLRYELRREVAPYIGLTRERLFGRTADVARAAGVDTRETRWVAGVRLWF